MNDKQGNMDQEIKHETAMNPKNRKILRASFNTPGNWEIQKRWLVSVLQRIIDPEVYLAITNDYSLFDEVIYDISDQRLVFAHVLPEEYKKYNLECMSWKDPSTISDFILCVSILRETFPSDDIWLELYRRWKNFRIEEVVAGHIEALENFMPCSWKTKAKIWCEGWYITKHLLINEIIPENLVDWIFEPCKDPRPMFDYLANSRFELEDLTTPGNGPIQFKDENDETNHTQDDPNEDTDPSAGIKNDRKDHKLRWDLIPMEPLNEIARVYTAGADKYGPDRWQNLEDGFNRYRGAALRHLFEYMHGNRYDEETHCMHLAQFAWNAIAMLWFDMYNKGRFPFEPFDNGHGLTGENTDKSGMYGNLLSQEELLRKIENEVPPEKYYSIINVEPPYTLKQ